MAIKFQIGWVSKRRYIFNWTKLVCDKAVTCKLSMGVAPLGHRLLSGSLQKKFLWSQSSFRRVVLRHSGCKDHGRWIQMVTVAATVVKTKIISRILSVASAISFHEFFHSFCSFFSFTPLQICNSRLFGQIQEKEKREQCASKRNKHKCDCVVERKFKSSPSRSNPGGNEKLFQNITKT